MVPKLLLLGVICLPSSVLAQFGMESVQPDVRFGEGNDRFDLTAMIHHTNRLYHQNQLVGDDEDFRRNLNSNEEDLNIVDDIRTDKLKNTPGLLSARRNDDSFAYHDRMDSNEGGSLTDFEGSIKHFMKRNKFNFKKHRTRRAGANMDYFHGIPGYRRSETPQRDQEVLMHYAMPIVMKIDGFMKVPLS